jgi:hypothetical protein
MILFVKLLIIQLMVNVYSAHYRFIEHNISGSLMQIVTTGR